MKQTITQGIVLSRTNYQEADRILTLLTSGQGKVSVLARGVRKSKSKMAGGIELFCITEIGYIHGRGELCTLTSARLVKYFDTIVQDINRTMLGYDLIKLLNKVTEDEPEKEYFELLIDTFTALDDAKVDPDLIKLWFIAQLLRMAGHTPSLRADAGGKPLTHNGSYLFSHDDMAFTLHPEGPYRANHIKFLRLALSGNKPNVLQHIKGVDNLIKPALQLIQTILPNHIRT
jgi:DNA repair protein RecO (recombination protein O)